MSGGSYNYASRAGDLEDVINNRGELTRLVNRLYELPEGADAAADLEALLAQVANMSTRVEARLRRLGPVLHAVEWLDSCDWGLDQVDQVLRTYNCVST